MGLFNNFFLGKSKIDSFSANENDHDHWADSITTGWEYSCNLFLITPKICIENDGLIIHDNLKKPELFGEPNKYGEDGDPSGEHGRWIRRHGYEEQFEKLADISNNMLYARKSEIGRIPPKSNLESDFKKFLIDFRGIVEGPWNIEDKIQRVHEELFFNSSEHKSFFNKLVIEKNFPDDFFKNQLTTINGVNNNIAEILWNEGYLSPQQVLNAPDDELCQINGIKKNLIDLMKNKKI